MKLAISSLLILTTILTACASIPTPLQGQFSLLLPEEVAKGEIIGEHVRWGGRIIKVMPQADHSCFEIMGIALDAGGRPLSQDQSAGRFIACRAGFYDPQVFKPGRDMTITGRIDGYETHQVGKFDYRYARVAANTIYLWPVRENVKVIVQPTPYYW